MLVLGLPSLPRESINVGGTKDPTCERWPQTTKAFTGATPHRIYIIVKFPADIIRNEHRMEILDQQLKSMFVYTGQVHL